MLAAAVPFVVFRSLVIPPQAALMNVLSIGAAARGHRRHLPARLARRPAGGQSQPDRTVALGDPVRGRVGLAVESQVFLAVS